MFHSVQDEPYTIDQNPRSLSPDTLYSDDDEMNESFSRMTHFFLAREEEYAYVENPVEIPQDRSTTAKVLLELQGIIDNASLSSSEEEHSIISWSDSEIFDSVSPVEELSGAIDIEGQYTDDVFDELSPVSEGTFWAYSVDQINESTTADPSCGFFSSHDIKNRDDAVSEEDELMRFANV